MMQPGDEQAFRYLLGELPADEEADFDERLLADEEVTEELAIAEDELHDAYVRDELTPARRRRFEERLLARHGASRRLVVARGLMERATVAAPVRSRPRPWRRAFQGGLVLAAAATLALVFIAPWKRAPGPGESLVVDLPPSLRGEALTRVTLDDRIATVELRPALDDGGHLARYRWTLRHDGAVVVESQTTAPSLAVAAGPLGAGLYVLRLEGASSGGDLETLGTFEISVNRR